MGQLIELVKKKYEIECISFDLELSSYKVVLALKNFCRWCFIPLKITSLLQHSHPVWLQCALLYLAILKD